jgi:hypothetical protein
MEKQKLKISILDRPTDTYLIEDLSKEYENAYNDLPIMTPNLHKKINIPKEFDGKKVWNILLTPCLDQGKCGSCWAFASTSTLADRFNIHSIGLMNIQLSPTKLILCDLRGSELNINIGKEIEVSNIDVLQVNTLKNAACYGNSLYDAWRYLYLFGTTTLECIPYDKKLGILSEYQKLGSFESSIDIPLCSDITGRYIDMCSDNFYDKTTGEEKGTPAKYYCAYNFYKISNNVYDIQYEIYVRGPVTSAIRIYEDFYTFDAKNDIYEWNGKGEQLGGHAIEITGWGIKNGKPYWQVKNSWGDKWGYNGYFNIIMGKNMCFIEDNVIVGVPNFFYPNGYVIKNEDFNNMTSTLFYEQKQKIINDLTFNAGGIDPITGYTRRIINTYPSLNISNHIDINDLPNWKKFIAGIDADNYNRVKYQIYIKEKNLNIDYGHQTIALYTVLTLLLIILIIFIIFKIYYYKLNWYNNQLP